ncbi:9666_t:CDS:2 [Cetraspora pellucida]|uniref:9666_t:CDS:1 n=1 Tax=Cetraspora pellucida TaxID=1433469 RepID=A0A9N9GVA8_9GLOM|nr:9666_t:CDS:2 [Cetraspora pellucida]
MFKAIKDAMKDAIKDAIDNLSIFIIDLCYINYLIDLDHEINKSTNEFASNTKNHDSIMKFKKESEIIDIKKKMINDVIDDIVAKKKMRRKLVDTLSSIEKETIKEKVLQIIDIESNDVALQAFLLVYRLFKFQNDSFKH